MTEHPNPSISDKCLVVGIGASAGGLESFKQFFDNLPADAGAAYVLIQHLDPTHKSVMASLLARHTEMPLVEAEHAMPIRPNHAYITPPNRFMRIADARLFLDEPVGKRAARLPIDYFFRSLAEDRKHRAVGIVLSGTGSDGSLGVREIKAAGGLTIAQAPNTSEHGGMPTSAIATGMVDLVVPIAEMPAALARYAAHPYTENDGQHPLLAESAPDQFAAILDLLRASTEYDFRCYKRATLDRRIRRRMGLRHVQGPDDYLELLRRDPLEVRSLFKDLLINVTRFFRDPDAWAVLDEEVIAELVHAKEEGSTVRVWVPGCATGEEAYSIAMLAFEQAERAGKQLGIHVFGTDLDPDAIEFARAGVYPESIRADAGDQRLAKYFHDEGGRLRVNKRLRESAVFATHNIIGDPPFSNIDLVSCRNLMIYLQPEIQTRMLEMFHFSLRPGGFLFLGNSESAAKRENLFHEISKARRIYRKHGPSSVAGPGHFPIVADAGSARRAERPGREPHPSAGRAEKLLLELFVPAAVVTDGDLGVRSFHGPVKDYLNFPAEASYDLLEMATDDLRPKLRATLASAKRSRKTVSAVAPRVARAGRQVPVRITARPLPAQASDEFLMLVTFQDEQVPAQPRRPREDADDDQTTPDHRIAQLECELQATREDLQSTIEELETSNEELKATNEEILSMNEELQSANEGLEASHHELRSLNEELNTVNTRLEQNVRELEASNNDITHLITSTAIPTIFLDIELRVRRFTEIATDLLRVRPADVGRPILDLSPRVRDPALATDAESVLKSLEPSEREVRDDRDHWYVRRIRPFRTRDNKIEGVVVTYTDITTIKAAARQVAIRAKQQAAVARIGQDAISADDLEPLLDRIVRIVAGTLDAPLCKVLEIVPPGDKLRLRSGIGWQKGLVGAATVSAGAKSQAGYTLSSGGPVIVDNLNTERRFTGPKLLHDHSVVSGVSVVIGPHAEAWGVIGVHTRHQREFTTDDANFLQAVANIIHGAVTRRRTEHRLRAEAARADIIREAALTATGIASFDEALATCVQLVCRLTGWPVGHAYLVDEGGPQIRPVGPWHEPDDGSIADFRRLTESRAFRVGDATLPGMTAADHRTRWIRDIQSDPSFIRIRECPGLSLRGAFAFPIIVHGRPAAIAEFFHSDEVVPSDEFLRTIQVLAEQFSRIFERILAKLSREDSQQRLERIVSAAGVGLWEWDLVSDRSQWDSQLCHLLGIDPATPASGETFFRCVHPEDRQRLRAMLDDIIARGTDYEHDFRVVHPDGTTRWLIGLGEIIRDDSGAAVRMRGINIDVTDRKWAEIELRQINETLEQRVSERTAVAEHRAQQLRELAFHIADYEDRERVRIGRLLHDDLQQLLVALRMRLGMAKDKSEWAAEPLRLADKAIESCRTLVHDVSPPPLRDGNLGDIVRWLARRAREQHGLDVELDIPRTDIELPRHVRSVVFSAVQELLFNVVKHAKAHTATIAVSLHDDTVAVTVRDDGRGFDPDATDSGTGFGLLSIRERITAVGGAAAIRSAPGRGSSIQLTVPRAPDDRAPEAHSTHPEGVALAGPDRDDDITVLIADDHQTVREMVGAILDEQPGMRVVAVAADGVEAVELARSHRPHIVVMDLNMPRMDGIEATRQIRANFPGVAVVAISADGSEDAQRRVLDAGAGIFLMKTDVAASLPDAIRRTARAENHDQVQA